jgi:hypothetical protein
VKTRVFAFENFDYSDLLIMIGEYCQRLGHLLRFPFGSWEKTQNAERDSGGDPGTGIDFG